MKMEIKNTNDFKSHLRDGVPIGVASVEESGIILVPPNPPQWLIQPLRKFTVLAQSEGAKFDCSYLDSFIQLFIENSRIVAMACAVFHGANIGLVFGGWCIPRWKSKFEIFQLIGDHSGVDTFFPREGPQNSPINQVKIGIFQKVKEKRKK